MPKKDIKDREAEFLAINEIIEQSSLSETCPCNSLKTFGECCGRDMPCDCNSHLSAGECCHQSKDSSQKMA